MVAWFSSYVQSEKHRGRRTQLFEKTQCVYVATCLRILSCYEKLTHVFVKRQLESCQRQLGRTAVVKAVAYIVSIDRKTTVYRLEACEIGFFGNAYHDVHSNVLPYFTDLPVNQAYIIFTVAEPGFMIQCKPPVTHWCNNLSLAGKRPVWIKSPITRIYYLREVPGFCLAGHLFNWLHEYAPHPTPPSSSQCYVQGLKSR